MERKRTLDTTLNERLLEFIEKSPSVYHVIVNIAEELRGAGYVPLRERARWQLSPGGKYYVIRGGASVIAFRIPAGARWTGFRLAAAHSDSPCFKLKLRAELAGNGYLRLNTEPYGGMLMSTWFDRPLSVAGRVLVEEDGKPVSRLVALDRDLFVIPSVAIHMNRGANDGVKLLANVDTLPLAGGETAAGCLRAMLAEAAGTAEERLIDGDLYLYCRGRGTVLGAKEELLLSPKLDDLECAWGCLRGFLDAQDGDSGAVPVCCVFHNEEVGSATKQGAGSAFLRDTLRRICLAAGRGEEEFLSLLAGSFLVSADNAHAVHPNHPEYADAQNAPRLNGGVVIKYNANQRYATDGVSAAVFRSVCAGAGVPVQVFANRSDLPGGSTLGSIADTLLPVATVDIGLAQLAMHSAVETAGAEDLAHLVRAMTAYFSDSRELPEA